MKSFPLVLCSLHGKKGQRCHAKVAEDDDDDDEPGHDHDHASPHFYTGDSAPCMLELYCTLQATHEVRTVILPPNGRRNRHKTLEARTPCDVVMHDGWDSSALSVLEL